jgi:hypothetical protein
MTGKSAEQVRAEMKTIEESIVPHKVFVGNRPTNSIMYRNIKPVFFSGAAGGGGDGVDFLTSISSKNGKLSNLFFGALLLP